MEKPGSSMDDDSNGELEDRDPNRLNSHLQVIWEEVVGEPHGVHSPECAWRLSGHCFRFSRGCCYILLSVLISPIIALFLGFTFACLAFKHIWCVVPCLRAWRITCSATRNFWTLLVQAIVLPFTESLGYFFYNIRVSNPKLPKAPDGKDGVHVV